MRWGLILSLLHIESLFLIMLLCLGIYLYFFSNKNLKQVSDEIEGILVPENLILKKKEKKVPKVNKHEERCREIFEKIFKVKFKSVRPDWLANPVTNKNLEIDGFNPTIKTKLGRGLGFEYDGSQHSKYNPHFHRKGPKEFIYQTKKDTWKDLKCKEKGIVLIRIPHFVAYSDLERYIRSRIQKEV